MRIPRLLRLSPSNRLIVSSWFDGADPDGSIDRPEVEAALDALGYTEQATHPYTRHQAAVAGIALARHESEWPFRREARNVVNGVLHRHMYGPDAPCASGDYLLRIYWRLDHEQDDIFWLNDYRLVSVWSLNRRVLIESLHNDEDHGYSDFAIGHLADGDNQIDGTEVILKAHWRRLRGIHGDEAPYVVDIEPILATPTVERWIREVWPTVVFKGDVIRDDADRAVGE